MKNPYYLFLALFHLNQKAVCNLSKNRGLHNDYHDYKDSIEGEPWHFIKLTCKHCGKQFYI